MFRCVLPCKKRKNKEVSWSTGENPFSLSGSCFSSENSSCDGSDSDFNIPEETPQYIKKLAPRAEFDNYEFGKMLGAGGFGQVISATQKKDNLPVAIKLVHKSSVKEFRKINGKEIPAEAYFQFQAHNRNVIDIYEVIEIDDFFVYVMERPENCKDLFQIIENRYMAKSALTEREARKYFTQVLNANICCEENGVLHRDVKPENILIDMSCDEAKLIDFGLSSEIQEKPFNRFRGTKSYMPPEYYKFKQYDGCQGTVWQMGILLVDMLSPVFNAFEHIRDAFTKPPYVPSDLSPEVKNLIHSLLNINPVNRPSLKEILRHPWIVQHKS
ncbi:serine/threonine-protein kinase pim-1-like isoform X1 [Acropora millepora]|uniref:serine/threonine-protein kinase pim-1-like isoform X1 n=1 Tax=Acropora millepora TaxID=45264 RepID=UPI001CF2C3CD|nr:serine/threonine-protein kinase pim-1-like isoform X1 [Acropora millepora]